ncbi:hypothetical protein ACVBEF_07760 [Glaciimonas sp. GG7]
MTEKFVTSFVLAQVVRGGKESTTNTTSNSTVPTPKKNHHARAAHQYPRPSPAKKQSHHGRELVDKGVRHHQKSSRKFDTPALSYNATNGKQSPKPVFNAAQTTTNPVTTAICKQDNQYSRKRQSHPLSRSRADGSTKHPSPGVPGKSNGRSSQPKKTVRRNTAQYLKYEFSATWEKSVHPPCARMFPLRTSRRQDKHIVPPAPTPGSVDVARFKRSTDDHDWDALDADEKNSLTLAHVLAQNQDITLDAAAAQYEKVAKVFNQPSDPEKSWHALNDISQRLFSAEMSLKDAGGDLTRSAAFALANARFQETSVLNFNRVYADALKSDLINDPMFKQNLRTNPAAALTAALRFENFPSGSIYFDGYKDHFFTHSVSDRPLAFDRLALARAYPFSQQPEEDWLRDGETSLATLRETLKRDIGLQRACEYELLTILKALQYDGVQFLNTNQTDIAALLAHPALLRIPFFSALNKAQKMIVMDNIRMQTGESILRFDSLAHAVQTLLTRFPNGKYVDLAEHPQNIDAFFNLMVGAHFAASSKQRYIDAPWAEAFWTELYAQRKKNSALNAWLDTNIASLQGNSISLQFVTRIVNELRVIAYAGPEDIQDAQPEDIPDAQPETKKETFATIAQTILNKYNCKNSVFSGEDPEEIAASLMANVKSELGRDIPTSISAWQDWLQTQPGVDPDDPILRVTPHEKYSRDSLVYMSKIIPWENCTDTLAKLPPIVDENLSWSSRPLHLHNIPDQFSSLVLMAESGHENLEVDQGGQKFQITMIDNSRCSTAWKSPNGYWWDTQFSDEKNAHFGPLLAKKTDKNSFYSLFPSDGSLTIHNTEVGQRLLKNIDGVGQLSDILRQIKNFSKINARAEFDNTFVVKNHYLDGPTFDVSSGFISLTNSWFFLGTFNLIKPFLGSWEINFGPAAETDITNRIITMIQNNAYANSPLSYDLTDAEVKFHLIRIFGHELMHAFFNHVADPGHENKMDQGLIVWLTALILQQSGARSGQTNAWIPERLAYYSPEDAPLLIEPKMEQFATGQFLNRYMEAQIEAIAPPDTEGAIFSHGAGESPMVRQVNDYLASLNQTKSVDPYPRLLRNMLKNVRIDGGDYSDANNEANNLDRLSHLKAILRAHAVPGRLFAQMLAVNKDKLIKGGPWRIVYLHDRLPANSASHYVNHQQRKILARDPDKDALRFLGEAGLMRLTHERQVLLMLTEVLIATEDMSEEDAHSNRELAFNLVNLCFGEATHISPDQLTADVINASDEKESLRLLNSQTSTRRDYKDQTWFHKKALEKAQKTWG